MVLPLSIVVSAALSIAAPPISTPPPVRDSIPYQLNSPSVIINLVSEELKEISGLSATDVPGVFCTIADEKGEIFFVDGNGGGAILQRVLFRDKGDFEGVEKVGRCLYAVKSNGDIYEVDRWENQGRPKIKEYETALDKEDDVEGLGYDIRTNALLVACKGNPDSAYLRKIYAFDLKSKQLSAQPVFTIDPLDVNARVAAGPEDKAHFFSPSGIAMHPLTGDLYVISSSLKRLVVLDYATGKILYAARLDKKILPQPEGISFDPAGNLYLSSEGKKGEGLLFRFDYLKN
ncbi:MAG: SdiA-regulated domain-containing protein [Saprospiraceae bacterium]|nr:SdiA-regulated domain-containing protein [Saprospiraceae bacterium]